MKTGKRRKSRPFIVYVYYFPRGCTGIRTIWDSISSFYLFVISKGKIQQATLFESSGLEWPLLGYNTMKQWIPRLFFATWTPQRNSLEKGILENNSTTPQTRSIFDYAAVCIDKTKKSTPRLFFKSWLKSHFYRVSIRESCVR